MFVLHAAAWAGPMPAAEADTATTGTALPSLSVGVAGEGAAAEAAAPAASGSALAAEIIKEADAGAATAEATGHPKRGGARAEAAPTAPRNQASKSDDPWGLREAGKATVQWVREAVPWLRSDDGERDSGKGVTLDAPGWSASPLEGGQAIRGAGLASNQPAYGTTVAVDPMSAVVYGDASKAQVIDPEQNIVRKALEAVREVLEHPMTWLIIALFIVGGIAVKKFDRRPTE